MTPTGLSPGVGPRRGRGLGPRFSRMAAVLWHRCSDAAVASRALLPPHPAGALGAPCGHFGRTLRVVVAARVLAHRGYALMRDMFGDPDGTLTGGGSSAGEAPEALALANRCPCFGIAAAMPRLHHARSCRRLRLHGFSPVGVTRLCEVYLVTPTGLEPVLPT